LGSSIFGVPEFYWGEIRWCYGNGKAGVNIDGS
jgi:hypothetical protein